MAGTAKMILMLRVNYWGALIALRQSGIDKNLLIEMNDSGFSFDEIADYLDSNGNGRALSRYNFIDTTVFDLPY
ncbi:MAG: hypothetical protein WBV84_15195 [Nitrososphaeraceae archaeon]